MPLSPELLERRAIQAGVKASKKRHQVISKAELLGLRVQTMMPWLRITLVALGACLIAAGWYGWPADSNVVQGLEAVAGILAILFGAFGVRRTLSQVADSFSTGDWIGTVLEAVGEAISNID
jgi:peptidoglycan/LPS O-acetylase OafA/YrhL